MYMCACFRSTSVPTLQEKLGIIPINSCVLLYWKNLTCVYIYYISAVKQLITCCGSGLHGLGVGRRE